MFKGLMAMVEIVSVKQASAKWERNMFSRGVGFILIMALATACSPKEQKVEHRMPAKDEAINGVVNAGNTGGLGVDVVEKFNAKHGISKLEKTTRDSLFSLGSVFSERVQPMAELLLKPELFGRPEMENQVAQTVYSRFHEAMVEALANEAQRPTVLAFVNEYVEKYIMRGCDNELKECKNSSFYRRVRSTKELVIAKFKYAADGERCSQTNLSAYYRDLKMAYAYVNGRDDPRLDAYYAECGKLYLDELLVEEKRLAALEETNIEKAKTASHLEIVRDHAERLAQIIRRSSRFAGVAEYEAAFGKFYKDISPLAYSHSKRPAEVTSAEMKNLRRSILMEDAQLGKLNDPEFMAALDATEGAQDHHYSYSKMLSYLDEKSPKMLASLKMTKQSGRNAYLVIVERIASRQWDSQLATQFFDSLNSKNRDELEKIISHYVRMMMLRQVANSNAEMGDFFANIDFSTQEMFTRISDKALTLQKDWIEFHNAVKVVRDFTVGALNVPYDELSKIGIDVDNLVEATNYMVVLPHMMLMAYKMYERKFEVEFRTWYGIQKISYTDVFNYFFSSGTRSIFGVRPWFDYSPGLNKRYRYYKTADMMNAFYFAMRTGAFEIYGIDPKDFIKGTMDTMLAPFQVLVRESYDNHVKKVRSNQRDYNEGANLCREERIRRDKKQAGEPYRANYDYTVDFSKLNEGILINTPGMNLVTGFSAFGTQKMLHNAFVPYGDEGVAFHLIHDQEAMDLVRLGASYWQRYLGMMREIYVQYRKDSLKLSSGGAEVTAAQEDDIKSDVRYFDYGLRSFNHDLRRLYTHLRKTFEEISFDCSILSAQRELDLFHLVYKEEINYLKSLYQKWTQALALSGEERAVALSALNHDISLKVSYKEYGYTGRTFVDDTHFHYSPLDVFMRIKDYIPAISPEIKIRMPEEEAFVELDWFKKNHLRTEIPMHRASGELVSEAEFVRMAMVHWGPTDGLSSGDVYVNWPGFYAVRWGGTILSDKYIPAVTLWYMMGEVEMYESEQMDVCLRKAIPADDSVCKVKKSRLASVEELTRENLAIVELNSVREDHDKLYDEMGLGMFLHIEFSYYTGYSPTTYDSRTVGILLEPDTNEELAMLDSAYLLAAYSNVLGYRPNYPWEENDIKSGGGGHDMYDPQRFHPYKTLKVYKESREKFEYLLFQVDSETTRRVDGIFKSYYEMNRDLVADIEADAVEIEKSDKQRTASGETWVGLFGEEYKWRRGMRLTKYRDRVYENYISQSYMDEYRLKLRNFNQSTEYFFDPEAKPAAGQ